MVWQNFSKLLNLIVREGFYSDFDERMSLCKLTVVHNYFLQYISNWNFIWLYGETNDARDDIIITLSVHETQLRKLRCYSGKL